MSYDVAAATSVQNALALLDSMDGRTTDRAEEEILIDLQDG
jgi:hypothetical protein